MSENPLAELVDQYHAGLDAEMAILQQLLRVSARQREATDAHDLDALALAADQRDGLMASLVAIEGPLCLVRTTLWESRDEAKTLAGYRAAVDLHREAMALVSSILKADEESVESLAKAELVRRDIARAMEQGETTLAAYRRVMTAPPAATLVDRLG